MDTIKHILKTAKKYNKYAGIHNGTIDYALKMRDLGFDFVTVGSDANFMIKSASEVSSTFKNSKQKVSDSY